MNPIQAFNDPNLFGTTFRGPTWRAWRSIIKPLYGLPMNDQEMQLYSELTGRTIAPKAQATEAYIVAGRRGGKSTIAAGLAVHAAISRDYRPYLAPGAVATIAVVAPDRSQARTVFRTVRGLLEQTPMLAERIIRSTESAIELADQVAIEVHTASARTLRGYTYGMVILDELGFFAQGAEAADADEAVVQAILPGLATIPGAMLLGISSPYARQGVLWDRYSRHYGKDDSNVQIFRAPTRILNPTIPQSIVDDAMEKDPQAASSEYLALFRADRDTYVSREIINQCTTKGRTQSGPDQGTRYHAFVDMAGGSGSDSACLAIAHLDRDGTAVLDCTVTRKPPFSAEAVVDEFAIWAKRYGIFTVTGDHFTGAVIPGMFQRAGINYVLHPSPKREIFRALLPMLTSGKVDLTDNPVLASQLVNLERSVSRGGTETIGHPAGGHDDVAVAAAGALVICSMKGAKLFLSSCAPVIVRGAANSATPVYEYDRGQSMDGGYGGVTLDRWDPPM